MFVPQVLANFWLPTAMCGKRIIKSRKSTAIGPRRFKDLSGCVSLPDGHLDVQKKVHMLVIAPCKDDILQTINIVK